MTCCHKNFTRRKKKIKECKKKGKRNDLVCEQYTNAYKLGAN
jgi:hypothetical protein